MPEVERIKEQWRCAIATSLGGGFDGTPHKVWGTREPGMYVVGQENNVVYFGLYGLPDFYRLWRDDNMVKRRAVLWAGSDIRHFVNGYWLDKTGQIRIDPEPLAEWLNKNVENYVENGVEHEMLMTFGIESKIVPSFLGDVLDYHLDYVRDPIRPRIYASVSSNNFELYGWDVIERIADKCDVDFYLYGNTIPYESKHGNVYVRGRVPMEQMNIEIRDMACGFRPLEVDGFSEITAKSVLWGQYPITRIGYPYIDSYNTDEELIKLFNNLKTKVEPNVKARDYYIKNLNKYPWNINENN